MEHSIATPHLDEAAPIWFTYYLGLTNLAPLVMTLPRQKPNHKMPVDIKSASEADWSGPGADVRARQAVAQMLTDMGLDRSSPLQVAREATLEPFQARGLGPMLRVLYRNHPYLAVTHCRPELASWRHKPVLDDYWRGHEGIERAKAATAKMLDELGLAEVSRRDPSITLARLTLPVVTWCGLDNMIQVVYSGSVRAALRAILPGIPPWRHSRSPKGHWQGIEGVERAQETTRTLIGEYGWAGLPAEEVAERVSRKMFLDHGLAGMLDAVYERRAYDALADIYPGLQPWQMGTAPHGYWSRSDRRANGRAATRWLIRRSGLRGAPLAEVATRLNREAYEANGLSGMLSCVYDNSPYSALQDVYPDLRPWLVDIPAPNRYWVGVEGRWHAREALHWMLTQLGLQKASPLEVAGVIDQALFARMGLGGMLAIAYNNSPYAALSDVFPTLRPWQMRGNSPMRYWQGEGGRGRLLRYQSIQERWAGYCVKAGIECTLHQLRHTHATELVNDGVSLTTIRKRLEHKNLQTTLRYAEQSDATADAELRAWRRRREQHEQHSRYWRVRAARKT